MGSDEAREPDFSEMFGFVLSSQAKNRARFNVILESIARIRAFQENREVQEVLDELRKRVEDEMNAESEELKEYLLRSRK